MLYLCSNLHAFRVRSMKPTVGILLLCIASLSFSCNVKGGRVSRPIPIKTITTAAGDLFDCVDIYKQPAFDHPLLKDHRILRKPTVEFKNLPVAVEEEEGIQQIDTVHLNLEDGGCPFGTVPIHRLPKNNSSTRMRSRPTSPYIGVRNRESSVGVQDEQALFSHMWAVRYAHDNTFYGGSAHINVYGVHPMGWEDSSGAQIWVINRDVPSLDQASIIRAGWAVDPGTFNDYKPRVFIEWSADNDMTGCANLHCPGFVQVNPNAGLGHPIWPLSGYNARQYSLPVFIYKDDHGNWWFSHSDIKNVVGYWPAELFRGFEHASTVHYGGVVSCPKGRQCPPMGNGHTPSEDMWGACMIRSPLILDPEKNWNDLYALEQSPATTLPSCYGVGFYTYFHDVHYYKFTFGGPFCTVDDQNQQPLNDDGKADITSGRA